MVIAGIPSFLHSCNSYLLSILCLPDTAKNKTEKALILKELTAQVGKTDREQLTKQMNGKTSDTDDRSEETIQDDMSAYGWWKW